MTVLAPARSWGMSRAEEIEFAKARRIPIPSSIDSPYTVDTNLWGRSIERGVLEDPWQESPEDIYALTRSPQTCPNEPAYVVHTLAALAEARGEDAEALGAQIDANATEAFGLP